MSLLPTVFDSPPESLVVVQTSLATPWLPFLHALLATSPAAVICVGILHSPNVILPSSLKLNKDVNVVDWTSTIPNYENTNPESSREYLHQAVLDAIASAPTGPVTLVVDSPDTLRADLGSISAAYAYLQAWYAALTSRRREPSFSTFDIHTDTSTAPTRMVLPLPAHSPLLPRLLTPAFSPSLIHLTLHPPTLLHHLATAHLAPAPPHPRFWALFASTRTGGQAEQLVWGDGADGWGDTEIAVEVLVRRTRGRRVEHTVEGWCPTGPCDLTELAALRNVWNARPKDASGGQAVDSTHNVSFNLVLTDAQQRARAQVPLPYVHSGADSSVHNQVPSPAQGTILYDPDSADDLDDDDPDEDLDI